MAINSILSLGPFGGKGNFLLTYPGSKNFQFYLSSNPPTCNIEFTLQDQKKNILVEYKRGNLNGSLKCLVVPFPNPSHRNLPYLKIMEVGENMDLINIKYDKNTTTLFVESYHKQSNFSIHEDNGILALNMELV